MKSNINEVVIKSYNGLEIPKTKEVSKKNMHMAYIDEWNTCRKIKDEKSKASISDGIVEAQPSVFNYHCITDDGLEQERTHIISATKNIKLSTYFKENKTWSSLKIYESSPEGIYVADVFIPSSEYGSPENINVSFEFFSNEILSANGIDLANYLPSECYGKNIPSLKLLETKLYYMPKEEIERFVVQVSQANVKAFYQQLYLQEQEKQEIEDSNQKQENQNNQMKM